jgi:hypothetical protein
VPRMGANENRNKNKLETLANQHFQLLPVHQGDLRG